MHKVAQPAWNGEQLHKKVLAWAIKGCQDSNMIMCSHAAAACSMATADMTVAQAWLSAARPLSGQYC